MTKKKPAPARPGDLDWKKKRAELRQCQQLFRQAARILGLKPGSPREKILREYLLSEVFRLALHKPQKPGALLHELHRVLKVPPPESKPRKSNASRAEKTNLSQHLEQLYGPGVVVVEDISHEEKEISG